jgi:S-DNA-T family DNA segregation ATPase FtsK/SpoIIIE
MPRKKRKPQQKRSLIETFHMLRRQLVARGGGAAMIVLAFYLLLTVSTFSISDPSLNTATARPPQNWGGAFGAALADFLLQFLGGATLLIAPLLALWGAVALRLGADALPQERTPATVILRAVLAPVAIVLIAGFAALLPPPASWPYVVGAGGLIGDGLSGALTGALSAIKVPATDIIAATIFLFAGLAAFSVSLGLTIARLEAAFIAAEQGLATLMVEIQSLYDRVSREDARRKTQPDADGELASEEIEDNVSEDEDVEEEGDGSMDEPPLVAPSRKRAIIRKDEARKTGKREAREAQQELPVFKPGSYELPALGLLGKPAAQRAKVVSDEALEQNARMLENVLADFGVRGDIINVRPGPVVTLYELEPAAGVKSSRVIGLADDIARSMSAVAARVAVVPGRNVIGIELPNLDRETVYIRELLGSEEFENSHGDLTLALGKSIGGENAYADLARMPHLLIAGTTGSGKSVGINTMILSLLYRLSPDDCKLIMIDPKMLELSVYEGVPHLLAPVVTDPKKAVVALKWTVREMEERYRRMSKVGVRNIEGFNQRIAQAEEEGETLTRRVHTGYDEDTGEPVYETEELDYKPMPFIVVIIDEVADLMMVAGKDIECMVQRLAQMARAAGIHLIMATQRPSVDVITGTIKANFPTRISFQVTSKIDSRTILGEQGAEQLLGMGDMLHMAGGGRIRRVHGAFVSDAEVEKVVAFLKSQGKPDYVQEVTEMREEGEEGFEDFELGGNTSSGDALYDRAVAIVVRDKKASTSYIQRRLQIGYNRAATLIERMEQEGVISPANHAGKREILAGEDAA